MKTTWLSSFTRPFSTFPARIPDEQTSASIVARSVYKTRVVTVDNAVGGSVGTHGLVVCIAPIPYSDTAGIISFGNYNSTTATFAGFNAGITQIPNFQACFPVGAGVADVFLDSYRYRCTAFSARMMYEGTELNRAGEILAGIVEADAGYTNGVSGVGWCLGQTLANANGATVQSLTDHFKQYDVIRSPDGAVNVTSMPSGAPKYGQMTGNNAIQVQNTFVTTTNPLPGIMFIINGDTVPTASTIGNSWDLEVVWHWEILPPSAYVLAAAPEPSPFDVTQLAACLNSAQLLPCVSFDSPEEIGGGMGVGAAVTRPAGASWVTDRMAAKKKTQEALGKLFRAKGNPLAIWGPD